MRILCGTDIIEISRVEKSINNTNGRFIKDIYTKKEIEYCENRGQAKYQHYAARFAAKEAVFKAISKTLENKYDIEWKDIEIENDKNGRPMVNLKKEMSNKINNMDISISHCKNYAVANVTVVWN